MQWSNVGTLFITFVENDFIHKVLPPALFQTHTIPPCVSVEQLQYLYNISKADTYQHHVLPKQVFTCWCYSIVCSSRQQNTKMEKKENGNGCWTVGLGKYLESKNHLPVSCSAGSPILRGVSILQQLYVFDTTQSFLTFSLFLSVEECPLEISHQRTGQLFLSDVIAFIN